MEDAERQGSIAQKTSAQETSARQTAQQTIVIVMPALNEEAAIGHYIQRLRASADLQALPITRILVVDNGSDDATAHVAREAGAEVIAEPRRGYGAACLAGVRAATEDIVLLMDADGSDDPADAARVVARVMHGEADLAMGSRVTGECEPGALTPQQRAGNAVGALLLRLLYGLRVTDLGPLRAIRREALLRLDMREMSYGWSTEMLAKAARAGLRVREQPVAYHRRIAGQSKVGGSLRGSVHASLHILRTLSRYTRWTPARAQPDQPEPRQALLIVARAPIAGQTKTRLGAGIGHQAAEAVYRAFLTDLGARFTTAAGRDGYDLYWLYTAPESATFADCVPPGGRLLRQQGADLGERLLNGFQALHAAGYARAIVIGSDTPHLPADWARDAFKALDANDLVIGPSDDGGYYLLGLRLDSGAPDVFTGIQMSTATVGAQTLERARQAGLCIAHAPPSFDVDEPDDLARLCDVLRRAPNSEADPAHTTLAVIERLVGANVAHEAAGAAHGTL